MKPVTGWVLKTENGDYFTGLTRRGQLCVSKWQWHAVRWSDAKPAREIAVGFGLRPVRLVEKSARPLPSEESKP